MTGMLAHGLLGQPPATGDRRQKTDPLPTRVRIVDRYVGDDRPMLVVDRFGPYDDTDIAQAQAAAQAGGFSGALLVEDAAVIERHVAREDDADPIAVVEGAVPLRDDERMVRVPRGSTIVSPELGERLDVLLSAARTVAARAPVADTAEGRESVKDLVAAVEALTSRFPTLRLTAYAAARQASGDAR